MAAQKHNNAAMNPQAFPNAVPQHKTAIKHGNRGFSPWHQFAVYIDKHIGVSLIGCKIVRSMCHGLCLPVEAILSRL